MRRRVLIAALTGLLLLAAAAETAQAQFYFGYGRGPAYGGFSVGSPYYSYGRWGYGYPYGYGYGYRPYRFGGVGIRIGSPSYYGYSPGYYSSGFYSPGYYVTESPMYRSTPSYVTETPAREYRSFYGPSADQASVRVSLPSADAKVWFEDSLTEQKGRTRTFLSPKLEAGQTYSYTIKATWTEDGREVTQEKEVRVRPGQETTVTFESAARARDRLPEPRVDDAEPARGQPREKKIPPPPRPGSDPPPPPPE